MRIFDFTLMNGYEFSGVDVAQGFRAKLFKKNNIDIKYCFMNLPTQRDLDLYINQGIDREQIISKEIYLTGRMDIRLSLKKDILLSKEIIDHDDIIEKDNITYLIENNKKKCEIICDDENNIISASYYKDERIIFTSFYFDSLAYTELYGTFDCEIGESQLERRLFWDTNGKLVFEQVFDADKIKYVFSNGQVMDNQELLIYFIKQLALNENDICILDRGGYLDYLRPLFEFGNRAKFICVLHSDQYYELNENIGSLYMNYEYYYWFKYSQAIDTFIVATEEQRKALINKLKEHDCYIPSVSVIPPGAIETQKCIIENRKKYSIISASRIEETKGIDLLIAAVIEAHKYNQYINLDIYGEGSDEYILHLNNIVSSNNASDYIHFMGRQNVKLLYRNYEVYASFSQFESFGLSLMEATGNGLAMIGLDTRYGNRLFIKNEQNGYLIDGKLMNKKVLAKKIGMAIVKIFENEDRLKLFHENSYKIASGFTEASVEKKWMRLLRYK